MMSLTIGYSFTWNKKRIKSTNFFPSSLDSKPTPQLPFMPSKPTPQLPFMPFNHKRDLQNDDNDDFPFGSLDEDPKLVDDDDIIPKQIISEALDEP